MVSPKMLPPQNNNGSSLPVRDGSTVGRTKRQQQVQRRRPPGETHLAAPQTAEGETFSRTGAAWRLTDTVYALAAPFSEEFHPLCVVHGDDLSSAFCLQRLQRAQQHPLLQAMELWREAQSEENKPLGLGLAGCWGFQQTP